MNNVMAIGGLPGLYSMVANRSNGLIVEQLETKKRFFASIRKYQFTPLESVAIYVTDVDSLELKEVFRRMDEAYEATPPVSVKSSKAELQEYFGTVLPTYDEDRVYPNDIKKVIKWFSFLKKNDLIEELLKEEVKEEE